MNDSNPEGNKTLPYTVEPPFPVQPDLTSRVASGAAWSAVARISLQLLYFVNVAILARKLNPESYGLMNMTQIVVGLVSLFRDIGIGSAVIQKRDIDDNFLSSLSWVATGLGCIATLACIVIAPVTATLYRQPLVASMLRALALSFAISSITTVHEAMLNRQMAFREIAIVEIVSAVLSLIVAIVFAYSGQGVWSLVAASLTTSLISSIGFLLCYRWIPAFHFSWKHVRSVTGFGMNLSGFNLFNYFARNADNVLIGRYLGTASLGFYQFAYTVMLYPVQNVAQLLGRVLFPAFSEIQHDRPRFRRAYARSCAIIALISFPLLAGVAALAKPFVLVWMGPKWLPVAALIAILAPVGMFQAVGTTVGQIYMATGRTDLMFRWGLFASPITVLSFVVGLPWGVKGVAISYAVSTVLIAYPVFLIPARLIDLHLFDLWREVQPIALATACMFVAVALAEWL
ncbi:MAG: MOP flippase family protein, partial [Acidobacteriaceae bacterium]|nr:MOP flippase family protein [Acidobacteriaceae bacterium]